MTSGMYIDEVHIAVSKTENISTPLVGNTAYAGDGSDGYKWIVAIANNTAANHVFGSGDTLRMCTDYWNTQEGESKEIDVDFDLSGLGTLNAGTQLYVGFATATGFAHSITINLPASMGHALPDSKDGGGNIISSSRFRLNIRGTWTDNVFTNSWISGVNHGQGAYYYTFAGGSTVNSSLRKLQANAGPIGEDNTWVTSHWQRGEGTSYLSASAAGDPHICTLFGEHYEFDHLGPIRLFDNEHVRSGKDNDLIIINGLVEPGPGAWAKNQYIRKLFIYNAGKTMVVDLGFRGSKVVVERNDGIPYEEEELGFNDDALMYAMNGKCKFKDPEKAKEYGDLHGVLVPPLVRNQITFELCGSDEDTAAHKVELKITLSNVNKYNLQPCRLNIEVGNDFNKDLATGCLIHRKYATHCALDSLYNIDDLPEPTEEEMNNIPELEIKPVLRNLQWQ